jgi:hypothetical protein
MHSALPAAAAGCLSPACLQLLCRPPHPTRHADDLTGGLLGGVIGEAVAIVVLTVVVLILIALAAGILVRGNFWLYPILLNTVLLTVATKVSPSIWLHLQDWLAPLVTRQLHGCCRVAG